MAYFICEKQARCCPHEFYDSIEQAITDSEDGVLCDHLIEVAQVNHGRWIETPRLYYGAKQYECSICYKDTFWKKHSITEKYPFCPNCGAKLDLED